MKNIKKLLCTHMNIFLLAVLLLTACGYSQEELQETAPIPTDEPAATAQPAEPSTEEELRRAIAELDGDETALERKQEYYERLLAMDVFGEADYEELAGIYGDRGNWREQRRMLHKLLRLYPSAEHASQLSAVKVYRDDTEEAMASLAGQVREALEAQDAAAVRALAASDQWCHLLQEDLDAIETRTCYQTRDEVLEIACGGAETRLVWYDDQGQLLFYREKGAGAVMGSATRADGMYAGDVKVIHSDAEGNVTRSVQGTLENNVCVGQLTVVYQGVEYVGTFLEDGTTAEEQLKEVTDQGGVIYAYSADGKAYLYQEHVSPEELRIGTAFFDLPEYEAEAGEWRWR